MNKKASILSSLSSLPVLGYLFWFGSGGGRSVEINGEVPGDQVGDHIGYAPKKAHAEDNRAAKETNAPDPKPEVQTVKFLGDVEDEGEIEDRNDIESIEDYNRTRYSEYLGKSKGLTYNLSHSLDRWNELSDGEKKKYRNLRGKRIFNRDLKKAKYTEGMKIYEDEVYTNPLKNGSIEKDKGLEVVQTLKDYAIKFRTGCGNGGTGWFLDYEIPEKEGEYPTKWFMGVAAHTISRINWEKNPYNQYMKRNGCGSWIELIKDTSEHFIGREDWLKGIPNEEARRLANEKKKVEKTTLWNHNLLYLAKDYVGNMFYQDEGGQWRKYPYINDFGVVEINFRSEWEAKRMTDNFYGKYHLGDKKRINFFAGEPEGDRMGKSYFNGGYPSRAYNQDMFVSNYSEKEERAAELVGKTIRNRMRIDWNDKLQWEFGMWYTMDTNLSFGASGSLVVDSDLNLLGILTGGAAPHDYFSKPVDSMISHAEPLKFGGRRFRDGGFAMPKYDLLLGAEGQMGSYREQLDTYLPNLKTYLREQWTQMERGQTK